MNYYKHNQFRGAKQSFMKYENSHLKTIRDDFNDMFAAESRKREKQHDKSIVFCLTYNDEHLRTFYGNNVLDADDLQMFAKSSAFAKRLKALGYEFDFVSVGEYGNGGESHNYHGKRGKGQNPHFHCVGWFHKLSPYYPDLDYGYLCRLLRREWQGCDTETAVAYGRNKAERKLGLGFVKLDGEIICAEAGGSYISKYLGKCMSDKFSQTLFSNYVRDFVAIVDDLVFETVDCDKQQLYNLIAVWFQHVYDCQHHVPLDDRLYGTNIVKLFEPFSGLCFDLHPLFLHTQEYWFEQITQHYLMFDDEFSRQWKNNHSPKLRKFHGFGYSLLDDCDKVAGTYQIVKDGGTVTRSLPRSLTRKLYYDYHNCDAPHLTHSGSRKVVVYTPNELGLTHFEYIAKKRISRLRSLYKMNYSLDENLVIPDSQLDNVIRTYVCVFPFDSLEVPPIEFESDDDAAAYFAHAHKGYLIDGEDLLIDRRYWINTYSWIAQNQPGFLQHIRKLQKIDAIQRSRKDCYDKEFIDLWSRVYATQY